MNNMGQQTPLRKDQQQALKQAGIRPAISGWLVLLGMALFFPIGFILLFIRCFKHWSKRYWHANDLRLAGHGFIFTEIWFILMFLIGDSGSANPDPEGARNVSMIVAFIFIIPALICYFVASGKNKLVQKDYMTYGKLASEKRVVTLAELALFSQRREKEVREDMKYLSAIGYFPHHTWDPATLTLVGNSSFRPASETSQTSASSAQESAATKAQAAGQGSAKTVDCPGCGAAVTLSVGEKKHCEFCGNVVSYS